jgi:hypothetical protein
MFIFFVCFGLVFWLLFVLNRYMSNYNLTASRFSLLAFACGESMPLKGVAMSKSTISISCVNSKFAPVLLSDVNHVGGFMPAIQFCPVCGMAASWGWFGIEHVVTNVETGERIWTPEEWLTGSAV